jgi:hypothetical protein
MCLTKTFCLALFVVEAPKKTNLFIVFHIFFIGVMWRVKNHPAAVAENP